MVRDGDNGRWHALDNRLLRGREVTEEDTRRWKELKMAMININGLRNRTEGVMGYIKRTRVDVLILLETWMLEEDSNMLRRYAVAEVKARKVEGRNRGSGGMMVICKPGVEAEVKVEKVEADHISFNIRGKHITACYCPPEDGNVERREEFRRIIEEGCERAEEMMNTFIVGDLNARAEEYGDSITNSRGRWLSERLDEWAHMERIEPTRGKWTSINSQGRGVTDHVLCGRDVDLEEVEVVVDEDESMGFSDHRVIEVKWKVTTATGGPTRDMWNINKLRESEELRDKYNGLLRNRMNSTEEAISKLEAKVEEWMQSGANIRYGERRAIVEECWQVLEGTINTALQATVGKVKRSIEGRRHFMTTDMEELLEKVESARARAQAARERGSPVDQVRLVWNEYGELQEEWRKVCQRRTKVVFQEVIDELGERKNGDFAKMLSSIKKRDRRKRNTLDPEDMEAHEEHFNTTFGGDPSGAREEKNEEILEETDPRRDRRIERERGPTLEEVRAILRAMPNSRAPGPDEIPGEAWKLAIDQVAKPLRKIFTACERLKVVPRKWNEANICLVYKKGDDKLVKNYRPIALTCAIRRVYEKVVWRKVDIEDKLQPTQGGFRRNRSTWDQILLLHEAVVRSKSCVVVFLDIKAAYDTVDREILWTRLGEDFGIEREVIATLREIFDYNSCCLMIGSKRSGKLVNKRGLFQGSAISPMLFNAFIDNLIVELSRGEKIEIGNVEFNNLFFADDGTLIAKDLVQGQWLTTTAQHWSVRNGIEFAGPKCELILKCLIGIIRMNGVELKEVDSYKYLGAWMGKRGMDTNKIIKERVAGMLSMAHWLRSKGMNSFGFRHGVSGDVYKAFLRPMMEYPLAIGLWSKGQVEYLQRGQTAVLNMILAVDKRTNILAQHMVLQVELMGDRLREINHRYMWSIVHGDKCELPVGTVVRNILEEDEVEEGEDRARGSLLTNYLRRKLGGNLLEEPTLDKGKIKGGRMELLMRRGEGAPTKSQAVLHMPKKRKHHLTKFAVRLKRSQMREILRWKVGKAANSEFCQHCGGRATKNHILGECGGIEEELEGLRITWDIPRDALPGANLIDNILWWADSQEEPQIPVYKILANLIAQAKTRITGREDLNPRDQEDREV